MGLDAADSTAIILSSLAILLSATVRFLTVVSVVILSWFALNVLCFLASTAKAAFTKRNQTDKLNYCKQIFCRHKSLKTIDEESNRMVNVVCKRCSRLMHTFHKPE